MMSPFSFHRGQPVMEGVHIEEGATHGRYSDDVPWNRQWTSRLRNEIRSVQTAQ